MTRSNLRTLAGQVLLSCFVIVACSSFDGVVAAQAGTVHVRIVGESGASVFHDPSGTSLFQPICQMPCEVDLVPGGYRLGLLDALGHTYASRQPTLIATHGVLFAGHQSRRAMRAGGWVLATLGLLASTFLWLPFTSIEAGNTHVAAIGAVEGVSAFAMITGLVLATRRDRPRFEFRPLVAR